MLPNPFQKNPGRPPKSWWRACVSGVKRSGGADDPYAVCGALWARKSKREKRATTRRYENPVKAFFR